MGEGVVEGGREPEFAGGDQGREAFEVAEDTTGWV